MFVLKRKTTFRLSEYVPSSKYIKKTEIHTHLRKLKNVFPKNLNAVYRKYMDEHNEENLLRK